MIQAPLEVYRIDMKYIRNLHNIDDRVLSVSPQIGKDERPFLGVLVILMIFLIDKWVFLIIYSNLEKIMI